MVMGWWKHLNPSLLGVPKLDKLGNGPLMSLTSSMQGQAGNVHGKTLDPIWHLLKGIVFWVIWIDKSNLVFNRHSWSLYQIESIV